MDSNTKKCLCIFIIFAHLKCYLGSRTGPYYFYVVTDRMSRVDCPADIRGVTSLYLGPERNTSSCACSLTVDAQNRPWRDGDGLTVGGFSTWDEFLTGKPTFRRTFLYKDWSGQEQIELQLSVNERAITLESTAGRIVFDPNLLMGTLGAHPGSFSMKCEEHESPESGDTTVTSNPNSELHIEPSSGSDASDSLTTKQPQSATRLPSQRSDTMRVAVAFSIGSLCLGISIGFILSMLLRIAKRRKHMRNKDMRNDNNYSLAPSQNMNITMIKDSELSSGYLIPATVQKDGGNVRNEIEA